MHTRHGNIAAIALLLCGGMATRAVGQAEAYFSLRGTLPNGTSSQQFYFRLDDPVYNSEPFRLRTYHHDSGTNAAGDYVDGIGFDPILALTNGIFAVSNDDGPGLFRDSLINFGTPGMPNPLATGNYRTDLTSYWPDFGGRDPNWAVDLVGPAGAMVFGGWQTNFQPDPISSLTFGTNTPGSTAVWVVGSTMTTQELVVGRTGGGTMDSFGGYAYTGFSIVGDAAGSVGTVNLYFSSTWVPDQARIGNHGSGTLYISPGGSAASQGDAFLAYYSSGTGTANVEGDWHVYGDLEVGDGGVGTLDIRQGGYVQSAQSGTEGRDVLGDDAGSFGVAYVHDPTSQWNADMLVVGDDGRGQLSIYDQGLVYCGSAAIAQESNSVDSFAAITGAGSEWTVVGSLYVNGDPSIGSGSNGYLYVDDGGEVFVGDTLRVWSGGAILLGSGELTTHSLRVAPGGSLLHPLNGLLTIDGGLFDSGTADFLLDSTFPSETPTVKLINDATANWSGELTVGNAHNGNFEIRSGSSVISSMGSIGGQAGSIGTMLVDGQDSLWTVTGGSPSALIGDAGRGTLTISNRGHVDLPNSWFDLGETPSGNGTLVVQGAGSRLFSLAGLIVGHQGRGSVQILDGGEILDPGSPEELLGHLPGSSGTVEVRGYAPDGTPSRWHTHGEMWVGNEGVGILEIRDGGSVINDRSAFIGRYPTASGSRATVTGFGSPGNSYWSTTGSLYVGGDSFGPGGTARLEVLEGGLVAVSGEVRVWSTGTALVDWVLQANSVTISGGTLSGTGLIAALGAQGVQNNGLVSPGSSLGLMSINGTYTQTGTLRIELGGTGFYDYDHLEVRGLAALGGTLDVALAGGFLPAVGNSFEFLSYYTHSWAFQNLLGTNLGGGLFLVAVYFGDHASLYVPLPGDANLDGLVTGADFTIWADYFGSGNAWTTGDFNGDHAVTGGDFTIWADHFGQSAPPPTDPVPIPEPGTVVLLAIGIGWLSRCVPNGPRGS